MTRTCKICGGVDRLLLTTWSCDNCTASKPSNIKVTFLESFDLETHEGRMEALRTTRCRWIVEWDIGGVQVCVASDGHGRVSWCPGEPPVRDNDVPIANPYERILRDCVVRIINADYRKAAQGDKEQ